MRHCILAVLTVFITHPATFGDTHAQDAGGSKDDTKIEIPPASDAKGQSRDEISLLPLDTEKLSPRQFQDSDLEDILRFEKLQVLDLHYSPDISARGLEAVTKIESLRVLRISRTEPDSRLPDSSFAVLSELKQLQECYLDWNSSVGRETCRALASLSNLKTVGLSWTGVEDNALRELMSSSSIVSLDIQGCRGVSAECLSELTKEAQLQVVSVGHIPAVSAQHLVDFAQLPNIRGLHAEGSGTKSPYKLAVDHVPKFVDLELTDCNCVDEELARWLTSGTALRTLKLTGLKVGTFLRVILGRNRAIRELELTGCTGLRIDAIKGIGDCKSIVQLDLDNTDIDDESCAAIGKCSSLIQLSLLNCSSVTDSGVAELENLNLLKNLAVNSGQVTDVATTSLGKLKNLKVLVIGFGITPSGRDELSRALPECEIDVRPSRD